jgi:hypothetical protein
MGRRRIIVAAVALDASPGGDEKLAGVVRIAKAQT